MRKYKGQSFNLDTDYRVQQRREIEKIILSLIINKKYILLNISPPTQDATTTSIESLLTRI